MVSFLPNIVIPSKLFRELQILTSSKSFPYPKGEKNAHQRWPYMRVIHKKLNKSCSLAKFFFLEKKMLVEKKLLFRFSQKDTYLKFSFLFPSVLLSCYHHWKANLGMYFCPSIFEHFRMVCIIGTLMMLALKKINYKASIIGILIMLALNNIYSRVQNSIENFVFST